MVAMWHGRGHVHDVEIGLKRDGTITGLQRAHARRRGRVPGDRRVPAVLHADDGAERVRRARRSSSTGRPSITNTTPIAAYRGAGRPEAIHLWSASSTSRPTSSASIRSRSGARTSSRPTRSRSCRTPASARPTTPASTRKALDVALEHAGYDALRAEQQRAPRARRHASCSASASRRTSRSARRWCSHRSTARSRSKTTAPSPRASAPARTARVTRRRSRRSSATRSACRWRTCASCTPTRPRCRAAAAPAGRARCQIGGSALFDASEEVLAQAKQLAAHLLEASPDDIVIGDGGLEVAGVPASRLSWAELAAAAKDPAQRPEDMLERLQHELDFASGGSSFPFGSHIAVVEVDADTGRVELVRHIAVDDCGTIVNPLIVAGQQHGGIAQGRRAGALGRGAVRRRRQPDHREPHGLRDAVGGRAAVVRDVQHGDADARSTRSAPRASASRRRSARRPAVHNAIIDALSHLGVRHIDMPCTAERVWRALQRMTCASCSRRCGSPSRSTRRSSATATTGCPTRRAAAHRPARRRRRADRRDHRGAAVPQRGRVGGHVHGRPPRHARGVPRRRGARRRDRRRLALAHAHRCVPVADRCAPGRRSRRGCT